MRLVISGLTAYTEGGLGACFSLGLLMIFKGVLPNVTRETQRCTL